jgi:hypothetical protein
MMNGTDFRVVEGDWFRGEAYQKYFDFLEKKGGVYHVVYLTP